jgi:hypothetical protein
MLIYEFFRPLMFFKWLSSTNILVGGARDKIQIFTLESNNWTNLWAGEADHRFFKSTIIFILHLVSYGQLMTG